MDTKSEWTAYVDADCILTKIPADTEEEARSYIEKHIKTGHLGPINIRSITENE